MNKCWVHHENHPVSFHSIPTSDARILGADKSNETDTEDQLSLDENQTNRRVHPRCAKIGYFYHAETCDVNFVFDVTGNEEVIVPAHKCILAFHSPVFRKMFYDDQKECVDIKITDTTVDTFIDFLSCIYELLLVDGFSEAKMSQLVYLAHKYRVDWLEKKYVGILNESIDQNILSVLWVLPLAGSCNYKELGEKCIEMIKVDFKLIIESAELMECGKEVLEAILCVNTRYRNEVDVFEMCINWAKRACEKTLLNPDLPENVRKQLGFCFRLIRFDSMTSDEFMECLSINSGVFTPDEIQKYARKIKGTKPREEQQKPNSVVKLKKFGVCSSFIDVTSSSLQLLLEDKTTTDVTFVLIGRNNGEIGRVSAHKCILARHSDGFAHLFKTAINASDEITIVGVSANVFKDFLRLLYVRYYPSDQFVSIAKNIGDQYIDPILSIAKTYGITHIVSFYTSHLLHTINVQNAIWRFDLSRKHSMNELKEECVDFLKENGTQLIASDAFLKCSQENFKAILELRIWDDQRTLVSACIKWAKNYCKDNKLDAAVSFDLRTAFGDAFDLIPFSKMDPMEFIDFQCDYGDLFTGDELKIVIKEVAKRRNMK